MMDCDPERGCRKKGGNVIAWSFGTISKLLVLFLGGALLAVPSAGVSASQGSAISQIDVPELTGPTKDIEIFLDDFFDQFSKLSQARRGSANPRAMIPLLRHTKAKYERTPVSGRSTNPGESATGLIAKLWMHGPKTWTITEMKLVGDSAFAKVYFQSVDEARPDPIPFGFRFLKMGTNWKIGGYIDLRSLPGDFGNWQDLIVTGLDSSPEAVFTAYMDKIEEYYTPQKAAESIELAPQVQESLSPMWLPTEEATRSLGQAMMTFSQLQPRNWQFVSSDYVEENSELVIQASAGNPVMRRNLTMAAMMGSGMKFTLEQIDGEWLLKSYGRSRNN